MVWDGLGLDACPGNAQCTMMISNGSSCVGHTGLQYGYRGELGVAYYEIVAFSLFQGRC